MFVHGFDSFLDDIIVGAIILYTLFAWVSRVFKNIFRSYINDGV